MNNETYITEHGGLVLLQPFLPRLFTILELTPASDRSLHLLRYLATGIESETIDKTYLENILCGYTVERNAGAITSLTEREKAMCTQLLAGVVSNWPALGNTSSDGLRTTFINRQGVLKRDNSLNGWLLEVEEQSFDMLIDQMPWAFRTCRFQWMAEALHVNWR